MAGRAAPPARRQAILQGLGIEVWKLRQQQLPERAGVTIAAEPCVLPPDGTPLVDWDHLREQVRNCTRCALHRTRTQTVFGVGNRRARWVIVGEAPGADEDRQGEPFVGAAGQLLNEMLRAVGLSRGDVFIANVLKCRPPENRKPTPAEIDACAAHLSGQLQLLQPRLILAVGRIAAQALLQQDVTVGRLRGRAHAYGPRGVPLVVTYHPAYLLRSPAEKRKSWDDLRLARGLVDPLAS